MNNAGSPIPGLLQDNATTREDMDAFDQLGPLTRQVINETMCVCWSARKTLEYIRVVLCEDPASPAVDRSVAALLRRQNEWVLDRLRSMT